MSEVDQRSGDEPAYGSASARPLRVFINYRHEDAPSPAWPLYMKLAERFGAENVFFDRGTLRGGMQWADEIRSQVAGADVFLAVIGPKWMSLLSARLQQGGEDHVVREIDLAMRSGPGVHIIPVLVDGTQPPDRERLPTSIRALPGRHVEHLHHDNLLEDIDRLLAFLAELDLRPPVDAGSEPADGGAREAGAGARGPLETGERLGGEAPRVGASRVAAAPDEDHYRTVVEKAGRLVVFLGAGANADEVAGDWHEQLGTPPDDAELARYLAKYAGLPAGSSDLAEVAQHARAMHGDTDLFEWLHGILRLGEGSQPSPVHRSLARLPQQFGQAFGSKRYQLIVTPKYDGALERAFRDAGEEFDVAVFMAPGTESAGQFVHYSWEGPVHAVSEPNTYSGFPFERDRLRLTRTLIVRINGAVADGLELFPADNYVITEDHYIGYFGSRSVTQVVPAQILAMLNKANYLFLGYRIADWRLRVFLHRIWGGPRLGSQNYWAVEREPDRLESRLWTHAGVTLYQTGLVDYLTALSAAIGGLNSGREP